jgi:aryl-alcohol dehydrogenase-like predicted oxidoreductase
MGSELSRLVLGTVQIGALTAPRTRRPASTERAIRLLRRAHLSGIRNFDTARSYGEAEEPSAPPSLAPTRR